MKVDMPLKKETIPGNSFVYLGMLSVNNPLFDELFSFSYFMVGRMGLWYIKHCWLFNAKYSLDTHTHTHTHIYIYIYIYIYILYFYKKKQRNQSQRIINLFPSCCFFLKKLLLCIIGTLSSLPGRFKYSFTNNFLSWWNYS